MKKSVKIECVIITICLVSLVVLFMKSATLNTRFQSKSQLYSTICLAMTVTYLLKHWEIANEIFLAYQIMKKNYISFTQQVIVASLTNFLVRNKKTSMWNAS